MYIYVVCTVYICLDIVYMGASCDFWLDDLGTYIMKCMTINLPGYLNAWMKTKLRIYNVHYNICICVLFFIWIRHVFWVNLASVHCEHVKVFIISLLTYGLYSHLSRMCEHYESQTCISFLLSESLQVKSTIDVIVRIMRSVHYTTSKQLLDLICNVMYL